MLHYHVKAMIKPESTQIDHFPPFSLCYFHFCHWQVASYDYMVGWINIHGS